MTPKTRQAAGSVVSSGRATIQSGFGRLRTGLWPIVQTSGAAALSWYGAVTLLGHRSPLFAAVSAIICLGASRGQPWRRAIEMVIGVTVGILIANLLVFTIGTGTLQIALIAALAMVSATLVNGGSLLVTQAGISAILVVAVERPSREFVPDRFFDALVGGVCALVISQLLFPLNPLAVVSSAARRVFVPLAGTLEEVARAIAAADPERAEGALWQARGIDEAVRAFNDELAAGQESARLAPPRRKALGPLEVYAQAASQVDLAVRNTRVLARAAISLVQNETLTSSRGGPDKTREALSEAVFDLARGVRSLGERLDYEDPELQAETRTYALRAAERATQVLEDKEALATSIVVGQVRLTASDLLRGSGMDLAAAQQALDDAAGRSHGL